jgi:hypothetical protein
MKILSTICFGVVVTCFSSCKKDNQETVPAFTYEQAAGIWVPYEKIDEFGTTHSGPFTANSLFGSYSESIQLNSDKTFIPGTWWNQNYFTGSAVEAGTFEHLLSNKLKFKGNWPSEWNIIKFEVDDLWLKRSAQSGEVLYKFKRQH